MQRLLLILTLAACNNESESAPTSEANGPNSSAAATDYSQPPPDVAAPPADAQVTASGLAYKVIQSGTGDVHPKASGRVEVHYTGWTTDGKMFDSSHKRNKTTKFGLNQVIAGWTEGLQLMVKGEKTRFWIPEAQAYKGKPGRPAGMLVFDVELVDIEKSLSDRFPAPPDVAEAPADAKRTPSGLAYKTLTPSKKKRHPKATDRVKVHYTGWQTDGTTFDSSHKRGKAATFPLNRVIAGWTEGVQLMTVGESARFWIPESLAYQGKRGKPQGMLVFDIELLEIQKQSSKAKRPAKRRP